MCRTNMTDDPRGTSAEESESQVRFENPQTPLGLPLAPTSWVTYLPSAAARYGSVRVD